MRGKTKDNPMGLEVSTELYEDLKGLIHWSNLVDRCMNLVPPLVREGRISLDGLATEKRISKGLRGRHLYSALVDEEAADAKDWLKERGVIVSDYAEKSAEIFYRHIQDAEEKLRESISAKSGGGHGSGIPGTAKTPKNGFYVYVKIPRGLHDKIFEEFGCPKKSLTNRYLEILKDVLESGRGASIEKIRGTTREESRMEPAKASLVGISEDAHRARKWLKDMKMSPSRYLEYGWDILAEEMENAEEDVKRLLTGKRPGVELRNHSEDETLNIRQVRLQVMEPFESKIKYFKKTGHWGTADILERNKVAHCEALMDFFGYELGGITRAYGRIMNELHYVLRSSEALGEEFARDIPRLIGNGGDWDTAFGRFQEIVDEAVRVAQDSERDALELVRSRRYEAS